MATTRNRLAQASLMSLILAGAAVSPLAAAPAQIPAQGPTQGPTQGQDAADRLLRPTAASAPAVDAEQEARLRARGEAYHRAPDHQQNPEEVVRTRILNAEIAAQNDLAENQERADLAAYEAAAARHAQDLSRSETERLNYEAELSASRAAQARYEADMDAWRARVRACEAGNRRACEGW